jgi:hypothetical protein
MLIFNYRSRFLTKFSIGFFYAPNKNPPLFFILELGKMIKMAYKNRPFWDFTLVGVPKSSPNRLKIGIRGFSTWRTRTWENFLLLKEKRTADYCSAHRKTLKM